LRQQRRAGGLQRGIGFALAGGHGLQQCTHVVAATQQQHHQAFVHGQAAIAHVVEHTFHHMGEGHHRFQVKQAGRALDGVGGAEDGVDQVVLVFGLLHGQQGGFHVLQQFAAFGNEGVQGLVDVHDAAFAGNAAAAGGRVRCSSSSTSRTASLACCHCVPRRCASSSSCTPAVSISVTSAQVQRGGCGLGQQQRLERLGAEDGHFAFDAHSFGGEWGGRFHAVLLLFFARR
jgi:hypothetical protein